MNNMGVFRVVALLGLLCYADASPARKHSRVTRNKLLLVSMDGFRWDYLQKTNTPNFDRLAQFGTKAPYVTVPFTTMTFPSHYTLVTGLYEEGHGLVANRFYDPDFEAYFSKRYTDSKWFDMAEPLWITAKKQGLKTGTMFWVGSETNFNGVRPDYWKRYSSSYPFEQRVHDVVDWLDDSDVDFATLYFNEPDHTGHSYGPDSKEVIEKVNEMDALLGLLVDQLNHRLPGRVNVILTSDHGMASVDKTHRMIDLPSMIDMNNVQDLVYSGPICHIWPKAGKTYEVYDQLKGLQINATVYLKEEMPKRYHYSNNRRIMPIIVIADEGWNVGDPLPLKTETEAVQMQSVLQRYVPDTRGAHGYDNQLPAMRPIFFAYGPNIKAGFQSVPFHSVDIYPTMCKLLKIRPRPNNGTMATTEKFLLP